MNQQGNGQGFGAGGSGAGGFGAGGFDNDLPYGDPPRMYDYPSGGDASAGAGYDGHTRAFGQPYGEPGQPYGPPFGGPGQPYGPPGNPGQRYGPSSQPYGPPQMYGPAPMYGQQPVYMPHPGHQTVVVNGAGAGRRVNHVLHFVLTILTGGLWLPVWIILAIANS